MILLIEAYIILPATAGWASVNPVLAIIVRLFLISLSG